MAAPHFSESPLCLAAAVVDYDDDADDFSHEFEVKQGLPFGLFLVSVTLATQ